MRRKTIIVLTLTFMVTVMVSAFSYLYISQILRLRATNVYDNASYLTQQLAYAATNAVPDLGSTPVDTGNPEAVRVALTEYLQTDVNLNSMLESVVGNWAFIYDASVVDVRGRALLNTNPTLVGQLVAERPDVRQVITARFRQQLQLVYGPHTVYNVSFPLQLNGQPFGTIRIGVSTAFLKDELTPRLMHALYFSIASIFGSLVLAAGISNLALGPLKEISRNLDSVSAGHPEALGDDLGHDEYGLVSLDFVQEKNTQIGALLIIRDAESVHRIEDEIEMSRRLSASGRLTRGVAHEVKNPINAIVLHLQLLQNKLAQVDPDTRRHMDIIGSEIHRP